MTHDPAGSASHTHSHPLVEVSPRTMAAAVAVTIAFVIAEAMAGWLGHSLALLSDAGHNLTDAAALGLSWYALSIARKPSHDRMTYGYHRVGIVAALVNAVSLALIAVWVIWEAIARIRSPQPVNGALMIGVALAAIVVNVAIGIRLHAGSKRDLNVRSAYIHMMGDAVSAFGVVVGGAFVVVTGDHMADPIVSVLIAAFILWSGYGVARDSATVLLEGTPPGTDMSAVVSAIKGVAGVLNVHDLHVWMVGPGVVACSCHIVVSDQSIREGQRVLHGVVHEIERRFHITHTTVQIEVDPCEQDDLYCAKPGVRRRR
jgi:cobalt-zinc-cadmium efflux system protein